MDKREYPKPSTGAFQPWDANALTAKLFNVSAEFLNFSAKLLNFSAKFLNFSAEALHSLTLG